MCDQNTEGYENTISTSDIEKLWKSLEECDCDQRCPKCGKRKPSKYRMDWIPRYPTYPVYPTWTSTETVWL